MESKENENLHRGHRRRMCENFMASEDVTLTDVQYLEMILFYCIPRVDTNPIAHRLLDKFGSIRDVFEASEEELISVKGMGPKSAETLKQIASLFFEYLSSQEKELDNSTLTYEKICDTIFMLQVPNLNRYIRIYSKNTK